MGTGRYEFCAERLEYLNFRSSLIVPRLYMRRFGYEWHFAKVSFSGKYCEICCKIRLGGREMTEVLCRAVEILIASHWKELFA